MTNPGTGHLDVVRRGGRSVITRAVAASPLRLLMPRNHGHAAWIYAATYGGGLVDGDAVRVNVSVGEGAAAMLSTQASTKAYRSVRGTRTELDANVSSGALLVLLPDPVVCFAASSHDQLQHVRLAEHSALVLVDWLTSGRRAMGERWRFDRYASRTEVHQAGRLVVLDALVLDEESGSLGARMGRFNVLCVILIIGPAVSAHASRVLSLVAAHGVQKRAPVLIGASPVGGDGCIVRIAGISVEEVAAVTREYLRFVPALLGDNPWARKW